VTCVAEALGAPNGQADPIPIRTRDYSGWTGTENDRGSVTCGPRTPPVRTLRTVRLIAAHIER